MLTPRTWLAATSSDRRSVAGMTATVVGLHILGWVTLVAFVAPAHYTVGSQAFGVGLGVTAYTLGMRHAFDADHIAAIDNTTRKLAAGGRRPLTVGFWFALGHSSVVFGLCLLLASGARMISGQVSDDTSALQHATGVVGATVSGTFLLAIAAINLSALFGVVRVFRRMRAGGYDEAELEAQLDKRGLLARVLARFTRAVTKPWHMYPVGLLFGLGFDTATEISLLLLAGGAAFTLPWYAVLTLPVLFTAGMTLLDAADGAFMGYAYEWALAKPVRKVYYNLAVTGLSVVVAVAVGVVTLASLLADELSVRGGPLGFVAELKMDTVGYLVAGLFVATWAVALVAWKVLRVEERWSDPLPASSAGPHGGSVPTHDREHDARA